MKQMILRKKIGDAISHVGYAAACFSACVACSLMTNATAEEAFCPQGSNPNPNIIWCDDFENDTPLASKYFDFDSDDGEFARINYEFFSGQYSLRGRWQAGEVDAGHFAYNFGRNPLGSQSHPDQDFNEIYWRFYMKLEDNFIGYPGKLTRATIFAGNNWEQAMIAHVWASTKNPKFLLMDPASGINNNSNLVTTTWNDFANLIWLGSNEGTKPLVSGLWHCVETRVKLNSTDQSDGIMEFWVDGVLQAHRTDLAWVKNWSNYGINSVFFSNYTNQGSPAEQERYLDNIVISTQKIGCLNGSPPKPPSSINVN